MNNQLNFPVGISDFKKIRENDYYYIDKSGLIKELLKKRVCRSYTDHPSETLWKNNGDGYACPFFSIYGPITGGYSMVLKLPTMKHCAVHG